MTGSRIGGQRSVRKGDSDADRPLQNGITGGPGRWYPGGFAPPSDDGIRPGGRPAGACRIGAK
jgi:hypothetical protein